MDPRGAGRRAFYSGPTRRCERSTRAAPARGRASASATPIDRSYGSHALYDVGKILVAGGDDSSSDARVIDINGPTPQVSATAPMANGRRQHNLTVLADGSVLATGGNSSGASPGRPQQRRLRRRAVEPRHRDVDDDGRRTGTRQYHSTALLLPDGRVLSSGGGICGACDDLGYLAKNAQVFTPPYLFKADGSGELAPRPQIAGAPATATHGTNFQIDTPTPPGSARSRSSAWAPSRTRSTWSSATYRCPSPPGPAG